MTLYLIDGNFLCYRSYYAIRHLANSRGEPTNAVYGFTTTVNKLIKDKKPDLLAVCFDSPKPTFRHEMYQEYKVHRKPMPDDLYRQLPLIKKMVAAYRLCSFEEPGFEADDLMATLAIRAALEGINVYIATGDKDALQLVNEHIKVYNPYQEELVYDAEKVRERYGLGPEAVVDIMALSGDASDNIPGVPGIGEKTAVNLIREYGSLSELLAQAGKVKGRTGQTLKKYQEQAQLSRRLAVLRTDAPLKINWSNFSIPAPDQDSLIKLFRELEFKSLLKDITSAGLSHKDYKLVSHKDELVCFLKELNKQEIVAFVLETAGHGPMQAELIGVSFCWCNDQAYYVSLQNELCSTGDEPGSLLEITDFIKHLKPVWEDNSIKKIGQDIKSSLVILANYGVNLAGECFDTMIASYLLNPDKGRHELDDIAIDFLNYKITGRDELLGTGRKQLSLKDVPRQKLLGYSCECAETIFRLKDRLEGKLTEQNLDKLYYDIEMPLCSVLSWMEREGVAVDLGYLDKLSVQLQSGLDKLSREIYEIAGKEFNINSPKQLREILFDKLGLPVIKRTKTGASTDVDVLEKLAVQHALPGFILKYRELAKLKSGYVDALPGLVNFKTGRIHTSYNQTVTATGRLSSSEPNLQNIPVRTEEGRKIRRVFIPGRKEGRLLSADYSQIELRILAHVSGDETLINAFKQDADIHRYTASLVFGVAPEKVTPAMRDTAKTVNFGIVYGMSPYGLSKDLGMDIGQAKDFIETYFERYPRVKEYMEGQINTARQQGFVTTLMSRRRYIEGINSRDNFARQFAERTAINTPIQGSAADVIKAAMINVYKQIRKEKIRSVMILQVHDELVFDMLPEEEQVLRELVKDQMESVIKLKVPIKVDIKTGENWLEA